MISNLPPENDPSREKDKTAGLLSELRFNEKRFRRLGSVMLASASHRETRRKLERGLEMSSESEHFFEFLEVRRQEGSQPEGGASETIDTVFGLAAEAFSLRAEVSADRHDRRMLAICSLFFMEQRSLILRIVRDVRAAQTDCVASELLHAIDERLEALVAEFSPPAPRSPILVFPA